MNIEINDKTSGQQPLSGTASHNGGSKEKKRAVVTTLHSTTGFFGTPSFTLQDALSQEEAENEENFDYLRHWETGENEEDEIVDWDNDEWGQEEEDKFEEDERGDELGDDAEGADGFDVDAVTRAFHEGDQEPQAKGRKMPLDNVVDIINECMAAFTKKWRPGKDNIDLQGKKKEEYYDPERILQEAKARGRHAELVEKYKADIQDFKDRLNSLASKICKLDPESEKTVRLQCRNLECHVDNLEEAKWFLSILEPSSMDEAVSDDNLEEQDRRAELNGSQTPRRTPSEVIDLGPSPISSQSDPEDMDMDDGASSTAPGLGLGSSTDAAMDDEVSTRPHSCPWPGCTRRFTREDQAKRHLTSHSKLYLCSLCGHSTKRRDNLQKHIENVHKLNKLDAKEVARSAAQVADAAKCSTVNSSDSGKAQGVPTRIPNSPIVATAVPQRNKSPTFNPTVVASIERGATQSPAVRPSLAAPTLQKSRNLQTLERSPPSMPERASVLDISKWNLEDLVSAKDRKRIVQRVLIDMKHESRVMIRNRFKAVRKQNLLKEISSCISMLYRKESRVPGVLTSDLPKVEAVTRFFLCWWLADNMMEEIPTETQLADLATKLHHTDDLDVFYDWGFHILEATNEDELLRAKTSKKAPEDARARQHKINRNEHVPFPKATQNVHITPEDIIVISDDDEPNPEPVSLQRMSPQKPDDPRRFFGRAGNEPKHPTSSSQMNRTPVRYVPPDDADVIMLD